MCYNTAIMLAVSRFEEKNCEQKLNKNILKKIVIYLLLLLLFTASCGTYNNDKSKQNAALENKRNSLDYNVVLPETWEAFLDIHDAVSFRPANQSDITIHLQKISPSKNKNRPLVVIAEKKIKNRSAFIKMLSVKREVKPSKFGDTYFTDGSYKLNSKKYRLREVYFTTNKNYYCFSYSAEASAYSKYLSDALLIFEKLEFKKS
ncbi:hypothetical protein [Haloflavibacter putidus]|uniref:PsbP C-terminal domain-containing protein n=1 Tax=Haloflavibacter putidus TaxID=2576776 RepID=A0A507ZQZ6_9FLAO|nr:hypothetical protein [Haloflavibacter putidus]TQD39041.1 hypothetical protein FKR84_06480 [Haloflavibacter putidus]